MLVCILSLLKMNFNGQNPKNEYLYRSAGEEGPGFLEEARSFGYLNASAAVPLHNGVGNNDPGGGQVGIFRVIDDLVGWFETISTKDRSLARNYMCDYYTPEEEIRAMTLRYGRMNWENA